MSCKQKEPNVDDSNNEYDLMALKWMYYGSFQICQEHDELFSNYIFAGKAGIFLLSEYTNGLQAAPYTTENKCSQDRNVIWSFSIRAFANCTCPRESDVFTFNQGKIFGISRLLYINL